MTTGLTCMLRSGVRVGASGPVVVARLRVRACARGVVRCPCAALFGPRCRRQGFFFFTVPRCVALRSVVLCAMKMWRPDPCGHPLASSALTPRSLCTHGTPGPRGWAAGGRLGATRCGRLGVGCVGLFDPAVRGPRGRGPSSPVRRTGGVSMRPGVPAHDRDNSPVTYDGRRRCHNSRMF